MKIWRTPLVSLLLIFAMSASAFCSNGMKPEDSLTLPWIIFEALNLPFSQPPVGNAGKQQDIRVLIIEDFEGRLLTEATWDGSAPRVSAGGKEWAFKLSALLEGRQVEYELCISIEDKAKLPGGSAVLTLKDLSGLELGSSFTHVLNLHGFEGLASDDGRSAALSPNGAQSNGLSQFIAMVARMGTCLFRFEQAGGMDEEPSIIIAESENKVGKGRDGTALMEILFASAQSWAPGHVLDFANAIDGGERKPDIRVLGVSDKAAVNPGEAIGYTYFLFNAGTGSAVDVEFTIPISAEVQLIPASLSCSKGELKLIQQEYGIPGSGSIEEAKGAGYEERTIRLLLTEEIIPGEAIYIEFEVSV